ncbi:MAG: PilZ domain-containing protein [Desulfobacterales bacterium]|nr:PilZ domain-containing protein [Desulfobacterales bacterium]
MTDRRKDPRLDTLLLIHLETYDGDAAAGQGMGRTIDISRSGVRLETRFPINALEKSLILVAIGVRNEVVEIKARIVRTSDPEPGVYHYGIQFMEQDPKKLKILDAYIQAFMNHKNGGAPESE